MMVYYNPYDPYLIMVYFDPLYSWVLFHPLQTLGTSRGNAPLLQVASDRRAQNTAAVTLGAGFTEP